MNETQVEYAVMMDFSPRQRPLSKVELMLCGPSRGRPISREEWNFWNYHILPYGHIIVGVPENWKGLPPNDQVHGSAPAHGKQKP